MAKSFPNPTEAPADLKNELEILEKEPSFSELDFRISTKEIEKALNRQNEKASPGVDELSDKLLILGKIQLIPVLDLLNNKLFSHAYQTITLSLNFLKPIFNKGLSKG